MLYISEGWYGNQNCNPPVKGSVVGNVLEDDEVPGTYRPPPMNAKKKAKLKLFINNEFH